MPVICFFLGALLAKGICKSCPSRGMSWEVSPSLWIYWSSPLCKCVSQIGKVQKRSRKSGAEGVWERKKNCRTIWAWVTIWLPLWTLHFLTPSWTSACSLHTEMKKRSHTVSQSHTHTHTHTLAYPSRTENSESSDILLTGYRLKTVFVATCYYWLLWQHHINQVFAKWGCIVEQ